MTRSLLPTVCRWWLEWLHPQRSRAFTLRHVRTSRRETYVVCLECGQELEYDLRAMRLTGKVILRPVQAPDAVAVERRWQDAAQAQSCSAGSLDESGERRAGLAVTATTAGPASEYKF